MVPVKNLGPGTVHRAGERAFCLELTNDVSFVSPLSSLIPEWGAAFQYQQLSFLLLLS